MTYYISPPPQNPLARIIAAIVAVFTLAGAFMLGFAALLIVAIVGLVAGLALWLRVAWIKRQMRKSGVDLNSVMGAQKTSGEVIDAEYTVVSVQDDRDGR